MLHVKSLGFLCMHKLHQDSHLRKPCDSWKYCQSEWKIFHKGSYHSINEWNVCVCVCNVFVIQISEHRSKKICGSWKSKQLMAAITDGYAAHVHQVLKIYLSQPGMSSSSWYLHMCSSILDFCSSSKKNAYTVHASIDLRCSLQIWHAFYVQLWQYFSA